MASIYVETTIPSYLTAWPAKNVVAAAHQVITKEWWASQRSRFQLFTSELVLLEASYGDAEAVKLRLAVLQDISVLSWTPKIEWISSELLRLHLVPPNAAADSLHIAFAAVHSMDFLITWNCKHIANAERLPFIEAFLFRNGFHVPKVCTPEWLMGEIDDTDF